MKFVWYLLLYSTGTFCDSVWVKVLKQIDLKQKYPRDTCSPFNWLLGIGYEKITSEESHTTFTTQLKINLVMHIGLRSKYYYLNTCHKRQTFQQGFISYCATAQTHGKYQLPQSEQIRPPSSNKIPGTTPVHAHVSYTVDYKWSHFPA